jgi:predicted extracellular nuclease
MSKSSVSTVPTHDIITDINNTSTKYILRVGQFNLLNLVKENVNFYGKSHYTTDEVNKKIAWISEQLKSMNACIVGFEEVFDHQTLLRATKASGLYQDANVITASANGHSPTVGMILQ